MCRIMEHELIEITWVIAISVIIATSTTVIFNLLLTRTAGNQNKISKKQIEYLALLEIMKIFNDPARAKDRHTIYKVYRNNGLYDDKGEFLGLDQAVYAASIRGTFDQMGFLVKEGYVPKEQFLDMYSGSVIRMYKVLQKHIETERKKRGSEHFAVNFESIFNEAKNYWKTKFPGQPEPEPF